MHIKPLVTVVTPSFNQGQFIEETILSVLNQTYKNIQYIIVDGGSTDITMEIVKKYRNKIDTIIHEKDNGQTDAINKGFKLAKGDLVGWLNSDDILYPNCIEKIVNVFLENPNGAIFYNQNNDFINSDSARIKTYTKNIPDRNYLLNTNYDVIQPGSFYSTVLVKKVGYLNSKVHYCMDLDLWLKLLNYGTLHDISHKPTAGFRVWEGTKTTLGRSKFLKDIRQVLIKNGASYTSISVQKTIWYSIKDYINKFLLQK